MKRRHFACGLAAGLAGPVGIVHASGPVRRIGFLNPGNAQTSDGNFRAGLRDLGYVEGRDIAIEVRAANGHLDLLPQLAAELVARKVEVIAIAGPLPLEAAMKATRTIPLVMIASSSDPVGEGIAQSLARPGGNLTGLTFAVSPERFAKQLELLSEAAPRTRRVGVWWDMGMAAFERSWAQPLGAAAARLGMTLLPPVQVLAREGVETGFGVLREQRVDAILVAIGGPTNGYAEAVTRAAIQRKLPTMAAQKSFTRAGGLVSYGPDFPAIYRRAATYVDRILKGARPGELPIELPTKYELALNLRTAAALGLALPQSLLLRADEVYQ